MNAPKTVIYTDYFGQWLDEVDGAAVPRIGDVIEVSGQKRTVIGLQPGKCETYVTTSRRMS